MNQSYNRVKVSIPYLTGEAWVVLLEVPEHKSALLVRVPGRQGFPDQGGNPEPVDEPVVARLRPGEQLGDDVLHRAKKRIH